jgi:hypothetical protein
MHRLFNSSATELRLSAPPLWISLIKGSMSAANWSARALLMTLPRAAPSDSRGLPETVPWAFAPRRADFIRLAIMAGYVCASAALSAFRAFRPK